MAIENVMTQTDQIENFAVCCTANLPLETINAFLRATHRLESEEGSPPLLTVVHALDARLWGPTQTLRSDDADILQSPFTGLSLPQVHARLAEMAQNTRSLLKTRWFLVLDDKSAASESAVIVHVEEGADAEARSVRVEYAPSSRFLSAASVGSPPLAELVEIARESQDGILRDE